MNVSYITVTQKLCIQLRDFLHDAQ